MYCCAPAALIMLLTCCAIRCVDTSYVESLTAYSVFTCTSVASEHCLGKESAQAQTLAQECYNGSDHAIPQTVSLQTEGPDEALRLVFPDGVLFVEWGPSRAALWNAAEAYQENANIQAAQWLEKLQQAEVGLAVLLECASIADSDRVCAQDLAKSKPNHEDQ
jgi:hypothetical protein